MTQLKLNYLMAAAIVCSLLVGFSHFVQAKQPEQEYRNIIVNGIGFKIPMRFYNQQAIPQNNSTDVNFLLEAELPKIVQLKIDYNDYLGKGKKIKFKPTNILVSSPIREGTKLPNLTQRLAKFTTLYKTSEQTKDAYDLHYLRRPKTIKMDRDEILFEGHKNNPETIVFCMEDPTFVPHPGCKIHFYYKGLFVQVSMRRRDWLPKWKEIKLNTLKRLEEFHQAYLKETKIVK